VRLEHGLIDGQGRGEVVHAGDAEEPRRFSIAGPLDQLIEGHPHLGEV
jgi:hypothetical protein